MSKQQTAASRLASSALAMLLVAGPAAAQSAMSESAETALRLMSDYLGGLAAFSADYEADTEFITTEGQKLQAIASGSIVVRRPDGARITRLGPVASSELIYDGKSLSLFNKELNSYFQVEAPPQLDLAIEEFRLVTGFEAPGADLLLDNIYEALADGVVSGEYIADVVVDGVPCYQLAFRERDVDWQIWIRADDHPVPMKYVITTKWMAGAPQYSVRLRNWNFTPELGDKPFGFEPPAGARRLESLRVDETGELIAGGAR